MSRPTAIEPFLEPETERLSREGRSARLRSSMVAALVVASMVALWADLVREGIWPGLPGPFEPGLASGGYAAALIVGLLVGGLAARLDRPPAASPTAPRIVADELPRLPVFVRFDGRHAVVVGGGTTAATKIPSLLSAGARVTVIAPEVDPAVLAWPVRVLRRPFSPSDLDDAWFVTAAATPEVNRSVREAAESRHVFVNAVDDPANATAYLGGTLYRGGVTVAFSTSGRAPALAGLLREAFDDLLPQDLGDWVEQAHALREEQRKRAVPMADRRPELLLTLNRLYEPHGAARPEAR